MKYRYHFVVTTQPTNTAQHTCSSLVYAIVPSLDTEWLRYLKLILVFETVYELIILFRAKSTQGLIPSSEPPCWHNFTHLTLLTLINEFIYDESMKANTPVLEHVWIFKPMEVQNGNLKYSIYVLYLYFTEHFYAITTLTYHGKTFKAFDLKKI
jgi:hypothetical protein